ncbi:hypothetical protein [Legionella sp. W05-934-2]|jgi:outer membrane protein assembly factor BamE (lipoprotein component of BamABCDE complex)|uniref:hypothetical protein n=1 Tax=Legionella sp. W05-934-2 TaxID=1198649 RepID=UPI003461E8FD
MNKIKRWIKFSLVIAATIIISSCAVVKATNQPDKKDLRVLQKGTERSKVVAELGKPVESTVKKGHRQDVFSFVQGYSKTAKTLRALGHGAADVYTLGLWEVVGTPIEGVANGNKVQIVVSYDNHEKVSSVDVLKGQNVVYGQPRHHHA